LEALGTNLSEFFREDKDEPVVFREADFYVSEKEGHTIKWIVPNAQKHAMEPILLELPPGGKSFEMSPSAGEEFAYVLEGTVTLCCDDKTHVVRKGETFYMSCNTFITSRIKENSPHGYFGFQIRRYFSRFGVIPWKKVKKSYKSKMS
jgi:glyoxylate utilization-related uncharacterized protein